MMMIFCIIRFSVAKVNLWIKLVADDDDKGVLIDDGDDDLPTRKFRQENLNIGQKLEIYDWPQKTVAETMLEKKEV